MMARGTTFLMVTSSLTGHLLPVLDLSRELVSRGHRVLVFTAEASRARVEAVGAELVPYQHHREMKERITVLEKAMPRWIWRSPLPRFVYMLWHSRRVMLEHAREITAELEPVLRREQVDCLVYDFASLGAAYAAERLGLPTVSVSNLGGVIDTAGLPLLLRTFPGLQTLSRLPGLVHWVTDRALPLRRLRAELGLPRREDGHAELFQTNASRQLNLVIAPKVLVEGEALRDNQLFAEPASFAPHSTATPAPTLAPGTVLVSTTSVGGDGGLTQRILEGLAPLGIPVLATLAGGQQAPEGLGAHVRVERFVPHEQLLPQVQAVVTHGGLGLVSRALQHGVPMLIIPLFADQPLNARLAESRGLAYHLPRTRSSPENIAERLKALLADKSLHARVERLAAHARQTPERGQVLESLERLARARRVLGSGPRSPP